MDTATPPPLPTPLPPAKTDPSTLVSNYTAKYDYINNMDTPDLFGEMTSLPPGMQLIDKPIMNIDNYIAAYPISGADIDGNDSKPCGTVASNGFYLGPDKTLGSNYFLQLGKCNATTSSPECRNQDRYVYVKNIPTGNMPILGNISLASMTGCHDSITEGAGLLPGLVEDISVLQPLNLLPNLFGKEGNFGGSDCQLIKLPVGSHIYDPQMKCELDYTQITGSLQQRKQLTQLQVDNCVTGGGNGFTEPAKSNPKTWWYEERCTPSFNQAVKPTAGVTMPGPVQKDTNSLGLVYDDENNESSWLPNAMPLFHIDGVSAPTKTTINPSDPNADDGYETFATTKDPTQPHFAPRVAPHVTRRWSCTQRALAFACAVLALCCVVALCRALGWV